MTQLTALPLLTAATLITISTVLVGLVDCQQGFLF
jgi:hypothetical protein